MPNADEIRTSQRRTWAGLAAGWEKWNRIIVDQLAPVTAAMIERLDLDDGRRHLDIASGTGEPGLTIAARVPNGRIVLSDLVDGMLDVAVRRASREGAANVAAAVCSADDLPFAEAAFASVSVRFGYMFFPDALRATAELARVLEPGGRLCSAVWVEPDANPWTGVLMEAIASEVAIAPPAPGAPGMYRWAAPGSVSALYERAGLVDVDEVDVDVELVTRSADEYWDMMSEHVSLAAAALAGVDEPARQRIRARAIEQVRPFEGDGRVRVPGVARCIVGTRPRP